MGHYGVGRDHRCPLDRLSPPAVSLVSPVSLPRRGSGVVAVTATMLLAVTLDTAFSPRPALPPRPAALRVAGVGFLRPRSSVPRPVHSSSGRATGFNRGTLNRRNRSSRSSNCARPPVSLLRSTAGPRNAGPIGRCSCSRDPDLVVADTAVRNRSGL